MEENCSVQQSVLEESKKVLGFFFFTPVSDPNLIHCWNCSPTEGRKQYISSTLFLHVTS